jgi:hypothetical protein
MVDIVRSFVRFQGLASSGFDEALPVGEDDRLDPVAQAERGQDLGGVVLTVASLPGPGCWVDGGRPGRNDPVQLTFDVTALGSCHG